MGFRWFVIHHLPSTQHHRLCAEQVIEFVLECGDVDGLAASLQAIRATALNHEVRIMRWMNIELVVEALLTILSYLNVTSDLSTQCLSTQRQAGTKLETGNDILLRS